MATGVTEWEFTSDVASWINELLAKDPSLPFSRAKCEQRGTGSLKRRDLTLLDKNQRVVLTGEVKLPFQKDGSTPYNASVVQDARSKAQRARSPYFFTWNVNECVLWETPGSDVPWRDQKYKSWEVTRVFRASHLEHMAITRAIQNWLSSFLNDFAKILWGTTQIGHKSPDEKFIEVLESSLRIPILFSLEELENRYKKARFRSELDLWMLKEQGWIIYDDPDGIRNNLERAARFASYALMNKLVFHESLLKRYGATLGKITVPVHIDTGEDLRRHLEAYFADAKRETGDYETVFGEDHTLIGNRIPFYSDGAVPHWRELIDQIHEFDFSRLDYEIVGSMFERLISPEERHKFGQFYTCVEVVDLINSFCIVTGNEKVLDPACGGGTFLVRAYARKRELDPGRAHGELLGDLFGVDISHFATHLTAINLATRDLIDDENYPQIVRSDFFNIEARKTFMSLPTRHIRAKGLGSIQHREIEMPLLDAVIGNPPYVRQEDIPRTKSKNFEPGTKEHYQKLVKRESKADLSGRSDLHCYFWPHASTFIKENGFLCFLTSSQWLDVEYGFRLQDWILRNFEIIALFESFDEPWFVGARVATTVTILRRQSDLKKRMSNIVRFVQLRRSVKEILAHDHTTAGAMTAADAFRNEILSLTQSSSNDRYRARLVCQGDLFQQGVQLGILMGQTQYAGNDAPESQTGEYYGGKWGVYLRAPDLWFELQDETGAQWERFGVIAEIKYGIKSGCDDFFYVKNVTDEYLSKYSDAGQFEAQTGYPRGDFEAGKLRLVSCGKGYSEHKAIESKYLEPEVHSLMEIGGYVVTASDCSRLVFMIAENKENIANTYALKYIQWGEANGFHHGNTCAARVTSERNWYDLKGHRRAPVLWPKERQYRHIAPSNPDRLVANCRLYEVYPSEKQDDHHLWGGLLNSTWVLLSSLQFGRPVGNEGNWSTMVVDVNLMLVPDPATASNKQIERIVVAFKQLEKRKAFQFLSESRLREMVYKHKGKEAELNKLSDLCELDMPDRRELDDAVLELLGVKSKKRRDELNDALYTYLRQFFEWTRQKEEKAIANKNKAKRRGPVRPSEIAAQILDEINRNHSHLLRQYDPDFINKDRPFDTFELPAEGQPERYRDLFNPHGVAFWKGKKAVTLIKTKIPAQDGLLLLLVESGLRGLVRVPRDEKECDRVSNAYRDFVERRKDQIGQMIQNRTADEEMQEKILTELMAMILRSK